MVGLLLEMERFCYLVSVQAIHTFFSSYFYVVFIIYFLRCCFAELMMANSQLALELPRLTCAAYGGGGVEAHTTL